MADRETVAKALEVCRDMDNPPGYRFTSCKGDCPYYENGCARQLKVDALELLKEQEAVEPILIREGRNKYYNDYVCPGCDNELSYGQNYCSECGRAVKWQ